MMIGELPSKVGRDHWQLLKWKGMVNSVRAESSQSVNSVFRSFTFITLLRICLAWHVIYFIFNLSYNYWRLWWKLRESYLKGTYSAQLIAKFTSILLLISLLLRIFLMLFFLVIIRGYFWIWYVSPYRVLYPFSIMISRFPMTEMQLYKQG